MVRKLQKIIRHSPMTVLEVLIHLFGSLIIGASLCLFAELTRPSVSLHDAFAKQSGTHAAFECLLATTALLLAFSYVFCRCARDVDHKK